VLQTLDKLKQVAINDALPLEARDNSINNRRINALGLNIYTVNRKKHTKMFLSYLPQNPVDSDGIW